MTQSPGPAANSTWFQRFLTIIERVGNALPHPATLFVMLAALVVLLSYVLNAWGWEVVHPGTGKTVGVLNLLSLAGMHRIILGALPNLINSAPLGTVLVCLLGIAVAEHSGLISAALRLPVFATNPRFLTVVVVLGGTMSHTG